jgi:hypothetical protein
MNATEAHKFEQAYPRRQFWLVTVHSSPLFPHSKTHSNLMLSITSARKHMATSKFSSKAQISKPSAQAKRQYRTASQWREILNAYQQSDLTQSEFCARRGISASNLYVWRRKLANIGTPLDSFIEIQPPISNPAPNHWDVELELGQGRILRVRVS